MKKLITILYLCMISVTSFSQQYYPLVEEDRSWNVLTVVPSWWPPFDSSCYTVNYLMYGDSILNTMEYKKFYISYEETPINWTLNGFIREDSLKRVWYRRIVDTSEVLLYDYSLLTGDSLKLGFDTTFYYTVDSITTETVSDSLRKKYWISQENYNWNETWIEGVGSNRGIINSATATLVGGWSWLLCMSDSGNLVYSNPNFTSCYINTDVEEIYKPVLRIYPNPTSNTINFTLPDNEDYEIIIYDALGSNAFSTPLRQCSGQALEVTFEGEVCNIDVSSLPSGIYFIEARGEKILRGKFVKV